MCTSPVYVVSGKFVAMVQTKTFCINNVFAVSYNHVFLGLHERYTWHHYLNRVLVDGLPVGLHELVTNFPQNVETCTERLQPPCKIIIQHSISFCNLPFEPTDDGWSFSWQHFCWPSLWPNELVTCMSHQPAHSVPNPFPSKACQAVCWSYGQLGGYWPAVCVHWGAA